MRRLVLATLVLALVSVLAPAEDHAVRICNDETLHGSYGFTITGERPVPGNPMTIEQIVGTAITTFDGWGNLTQTDNIHGFTGDYVADRPGKGKYTLNSDCTGTMTLHNDGTPFDLVLSIVVVDDGREVRTAVVNVSPAQMSIPPIMVTSNGRKIR
jgi:hypothetical protein